MKYVKYLPLITLFSFPLSAPAAAVLVQFGGDYTHIFENNAVEDTNWQNAIGADQIIMWNGKDSTDSSFGANGTMNDVGIGATLSSINDEVTITTVGLSSNSVPAGGLTTTASSLPNFVGIVSDLGNTRFGSNQEEIWTIQFDTDVTLVGVVNNVMGFDTERFGIDLGADGSYEYDWARTGFNVGSGSISSVAFGGVDEYYFEFTSGGIEIAAGTSVSFASLQGDIGIEALVVSVIPEPSTFSLWAGIGALLLIANRRSR